MKLTLFSVLELIRDGIRVVNTIYNMHNKLTYTCHLYKC